MTMTQPLSKTNTFRLVTQNVDKSGPIPYRSPNSGKWAHLVFTQESVLHNQLPKRYKNHPTPNPQTKASFLKGWHRTWVNHKSWKLHGGISKFTPRRTLEADFFVRKNFKLMVINTHLINAAWNNKKDKWDWLRKILWKHSIRKLNRKVKRFKSRGWEILVVGDFNRQNFRIKRLNRLHSKGPDAIYGTRNIKVEHAYLGPKAGPIHHALWLEFYVSY